MITLAFALTMLAVFGIARYNKSVSLFFILLAMSLGGFAGGALASRFISDDTDDTNSAQVQSMQENQQGIGLFTLLDSRNAEMPLLASKAKETPVCDTEECIKLQSKINQKVPTNPPQRVEYQDDS